MVWLPGILQAVPAVPDAGLAEVPGWALRGLRASRRLAAGRGLQRAAAAAAPAPGPHARLALARPHRQEGQHQEGRPATYHTGQYFKFLSLKA